MKPKSCLPGQQRRRRGMALVIVLSSTALLMVLVLAMLVTGRTETRSAAAFSKSVEVRTLADMPVNLVMAQIRKATSDLGATKAWISQPGMIRVFGTEAGKDGRSKLESAWKLYSSNEMVAGTDFDATAEAESLKSWKTQPALFTDLNQPVAIAERNGTVRRAYPILDPTALGKVEGLSVAGGAAPGATPEQPMPMPVRWLYLLQDGRMVLPQAGTGTKVTFDEEAVTKENPIVGRIAFWTDDESCKVNINTASEGTPWDVPRSVSWTERNYGTYLPAQNEFQRYPGHPAMTCLSTVLQAFDDRYKPQQPGFDVNGKVTNNQFASFLGDIYGLLPRTNHGDKPGESSKGGTQLAAFNTANSSYIIDPATGKPIVLPVKRERLFATVDELFHNSSRGANAGIEPEELQMGKFFLTAHSRAPETNLFNRPRVSLWPLQADKAKRNAKDKLLAFCATAAGQECGFQRATTFTGQANGKWGSSQSAKEDFQLAHNQRLLGYARALTSRPVPGFGQGGRETFAQKYGDMNHAQILVQMFDLQRWGVNSYSTALTPAYTYLPSRDGTNPGLMGETSAVPVMTSTMPGANGALPGPVKAFGRFHTIVEASIVFMATEVEGDTADETKKAVRSGTRDIMPLDKKKNLTGADGADGWADNTHKMRAYLILQPFSPTVGMPSWSANIRYVIKGLEQFKADGASLGFPPMAVNRARRPNGYVGDGGHCTSFTGVASQFYQFNGSTKSVLNKGGGSEDTNYPFVGIEIDVKDKKTFSFEGGTITVELRTGFPATVAQSELVQTLRLNFPPTTLRVPRLGKNPTGRWKDSEDQSENNWLTRFMSLTERIRYVSRGGTGYPTTSWDSLLNDWKRDEYGNILGNGGNGRQIIVGWGDMARSVVANPMSPASGDLRVMAALPEVPESYFMPHPDYDNITMEEAQSLRHAGTAYTGHFGNTHKASHLPNNAGRQHTWQMAGYAFNSKSKKVTKAYGLLKDVPYWQDCQPAVPMLLDGAWNADNRPGDWDNGTGRIEDGPYINKPDEGNLDTGNGYFSRGTFAVDSGRSFAPNRQICSAVAFGSLPTGVHPQNGSSAPRPWQTLLFCPNPPSRTTAALAEPTEQDHLGFKSPRDHLLLDLFWMPVVEPYAISEPLSTGGKVNINAQMLPFSYIERHTALHAALHTVRVSALPSQLAWAKNAGTTGANGSQLPECYKSWSNWLKFDTVYEVNTAETLKGFQHRFNHNDVFRSASEICDIFLVPKTSPGRAYSPNPSSKPSKMPAYKNIAEWWNGSLDKQDDGFELTGDNTRESPYNQLYPRLTTRSNVFQVHYRVQLIKKARSSAPAEWDEEKEMPAAEMRGSTLFERYIDPNDPALPNFVANPDAEGALDDHYRFRVIRQKQFAP